MVGDQADEDIIMREDAVSESKSIRPALGERAARLPRPRGGVSTGELAGLNVGYGSDDDPQRSPKTAGARWRRCCPARARHGPPGPFRRCRSSSAPGRGAPPPRRRHGHRPPGILLGILTADCAPVLLADPEGRRDRARRMPAGAARSAASPTATVAAMEKLGARRERIRAAVGPCIAQASYEVDEASATASSTRTRRTSASS